MIKNVIQLFLSIFVVTLTIACGNSYSQEQTSLSATEFSEKMTKDAAATIIDVRTPQEFERGHIASAKNIVWGGNFDEEIKNLDKEKNMYVYCLSGARSNRAAESMRAAGFKHVYELSGGILTWRSANLPEVTDDAVAQSTGMSKADFTQAITSDKIVLVDFYAEWCPPCKLMAPYLKEIDADMQDKVKVLRIDADKNQELLKELGIDELPVLQVYKNQALSWTHTGLIEKEKVLQQLN